MQQNPKKIKTKTILRIVLICTFATVFIVSAIMLINTILSYRKAADFYGSIHDEFISIIKSTGTGEGETGKIVWIDPDEDTINTLPTPSETGGTTDPSGTGGAVTTTKEPPTTTAPKEEPSEYFIKISDMIKDFQKINEEVVGYIYIDFGNSEHISYPICRNDDNLYYTTHASDRTEMKSGAIFLDSRCDPILPSNDVALIFGHNMNDRSMFNRLTNFKKAEHFNNVTISIYTLQGIYTYRAFSVHNVKAYDDYTDISFRTDNDYLAFLKRMQGQSIITNSIKLSASSKIITLSTCLNTTRDARLAVHAVLVSISR